MRKLTTWLNAFVLIIAFILPPAFVDAQPTNRGGDVRIGAEHLSIDQAYKLARQNYPLIKQRDLVTKTREYTITNAARGYLPALNINGQATYQSDVTNIPFKIPGVNIPQFSKDQYKIYGEVDQVIYDGGVIKNQKESARANEEIQQQNIEVELYALYDRVNQLFLGALLIDEQLKQNDLLKKDIQNGIDKSKALVANGTAFRSTVDELQAQLLTTDQARVELEANRKAYIEMLGLFINKPADLIVLEKPAPPAIADVVTRPELTYYDFQKRAYDVQEDLLKTQLRPKFNFFVQGGYGRPGLNMFSNDFEWYYIGGLRLIWNLGSLYTLHNQKQILGLNRDMLDVQKETFLFNSQVTMKQQNADVKKYMELLNKDDEIIALRESVKTASSAQLENGVLSAHDYVTEVNAEDEARQGRILHEVQLLQAQYNYQNTMGNIKN
jgi:outer membrane protein TolC